MRLVQMGRRTPRRLRDTTAGGAQLLALATGVRWLSKTSRTTTTIGTDIQRFAIRPLLSALHHAHHPMGCEID